MIVEETIKEAKLLKYFDNSVAVEIIGFILDTNKIEIKLKS